MITQPTLKVKYYIALQGLQLAMTAMFGVFISVQLDAYVDSLLFDACSLVIYDNQS